MTYSSKDWSRAITKLTELTSTGSVQWMLTDTYNENIHDVVDRAFSCEYAGSRYVVKETRRRNYVDEEEFFWVDDIKLEVYKHLVPGGPEVLISAAPMTPVIGRLLTAIEASFAFQQGALKGLLDD